MSIVKHYLKNEDFCKVTFTWKDNDEEIKNLKILGDFNNWNRNCKPMRAFNHGRFSQSIILKSGNTHQIRYLINDSVWEDVPEADGYSLNGIDTGDFNSLILIK
jgi:hypothetical protein